jgi:predicted esterase
MSTKLKVLSLHGWGTNAEIMNHQLRHFRSTLGETAEFVIVEAPNTIRKQTDKVLLDRFPGTYYEWFRRQKRKSEQESFEYVTVGLERSIAMLELFIEANGPFDGVLGFSQGGVMALVLIALSESGRIRTHFKFCLLVAVGVLHLNEYWELLPPDFPITFVVGTKDPMKYSTYLTATYFTNSQFLTTEDDHRIPKLNDEETKQVREFIIHYGRPPRL